MKVVYAALMIVFCAILALTIMSKEVDGLKVSLPDLRYEIIESNGEYNESDRDLLYSAGNNNFTRNSYGYYDLDSSEIGEVQEFLLADINFFNFTEFDRFYIEYYSPSEYDLDLNFRFSYREPFGNLSIMNFARYEKDYVLDELIDGNYFDENSAMALFPIIYSLDNYYPRAGICFDAGLGGYSNNTYYYDGEHKFNLPAANDEFETFTIDIRNNFGAHYPELRMYAEIWLTNVNLTYVRDYGFYKDIGELPESYKTEEFIFYPLYDLHSEIIINYNVSDYDRTVFESYTLFGDDIGICGYGDTTQFHFNYFFYNSSYGAGDEYDDKLSMWYYTDSLTTGSQMQILDAHYHANSVYQTSDWDLQYAETGWAMILNSNALIHYYKSNFNRQFSDYSEIYSMEKFTVSYIEEKEYYGFYYRPEIANITIDYPQTELTIYETNRDRLDIIYKESETSKDDREAWKIRGDWGGFDSLRKGLNAIIGVIGGIVYLVVDGVSGIGDSIGGLQDGIDGVISAMSNIGDSLGDVGDDLGESLEIFDDIGTWFSDIGDAIQEAIDAIGELKVIMDIGEGLDGILQTLEDIFATLQAFFDSIITWMESLYEGFISSVTFVFTILPILLGIYLGGLCIFTLWRQLQYIEKGEGDMGDILHQFLLGIFLPIQIIFTIFKLIVDVVVNLIPLT